MVEKERTRSGKQLNKEMNENETWILMKKIIKSQMTITKNLFSYNKSNVSYRC